MTIADQKDLLSRFNAWAEVGGEIFATERLRKEFQNRVAENQGFWEKTGNTGHQFVDNGAGMILRLAGMTTGLVSGIWRDEGESLLESCFR